MVEIELNVNTGGVWLFSNTMMRMLVWMGMVEIELNVNTGGVPWW